jgi:hypothetical protein
LDPTSWSSQYHLAFQLSELRQITPALESARQAVKLNHGSVEAWHLLGLLVAAQKNLGESLLVLETGIEEGNIIGQSSETDDEEDENDGHESLMTGRGASLADGLSVRDGVSTKRLSRPASTSFADQLRFSQFGMQDDSRRQSASNHPTGNSISAVPSADFDTPRDETDVLVSQLQIRMTRNVVIESTEGAGSALADQQNLLKFFARAVGGLTDQAGKLRLVSYH